LQECRKAFEEELKAAEEKEMQGLLSHASRRTGKVV
jgi:hypothetical protein